VLPSAPKRIKPSGPTTARIAIVGDYPHQQDELVGSPFMSKGGQELTRILADAGIPRADCYLTTVFKTRPAHDKIEAFCGKKAEVGGKSYALPGISMGNYVRPEFLFELSELRTELESIQPNLVIALGNVACWALLQNPKITSIRGTIAESTLVPGLKVLPTFHPAIVFKQWQNRAICIMDFIKAKKESQFPEIVRPLREIWIRPDLADLEIFHERYIKEAKELSFDIETESGQITCIGFAVNSEVALVIPITDKEKPGFSYWTHAEELLVWEFIRKVCANSIPKIGQNGLYDIQYLWRIMGIPVWNYLEDTMIMMHSIYSELPKGLGFLGSIFTNEASWKGMHHHKTKEQYTVKKDD
jgi:uracil-DNA glycosylase